MISIPSEAARWINAFPVGRCIRCGIMSGAARPNVRFLQCTLRFGDGPRRDIAQLSRSLNSCIVCLYTRWCLMDASPMLVLLRGELNEISTP
jgi:hypothetical protein